MNRTGSARLPPALRGLACSLLAGLVFALGTPAEAQTCTPPAFWNELGPGGGRSEVHLCAEGFTRDEDRCLLNGKFAGYAASCAVGWEVRAVEGPGLYDMWCVGPSPDGKPPERTRRILTRRIGLVHATEVDNRGGTYRFTLETPQTVSVSLAGMNRNFDCSVNGSSCSNRGGTRDDDWTGELEPGWHSVRVSPSGGSRGDYTILAVVWCPPGHFAHGGSCRRPVPAHARPEGGTPTPRGDDGAADPAPEGEPPP